MNGLMDSSGLFDDDDAGLIATHTESTSAIGKDMWSEWLGKRLANAVISQRNKMTWTALSSG